MTKGGKRRKTRRKEVWGAGGAGGEEWRSFDDKSRHTARQHIRTHTRTCGTATPLQTGAVGQTGGREELS